MRELKKVAVIVGLLLAGLALGPPAGAAPGGVFGTPERVGCVISVEITFEDPQEYWFTVYDDGVLRYADSVVTTEAGQTHVFSFNIAVLEAGTAPGIALAIRDSELSLSAYASVLDEFEGPPAVKAACLASGGIDSGEQPEVEITTTTPIVIEGGTGNFRVTRSFSGYALDVNLAYGGQATPGVDTAVLPTTVTIPEGETVVDVPVPTVVDGIPEGGEPLVATVVAGDYLFGAVTSATLVIHDPPEVTRPPGGGGTVPTTVPTPTTGPPPTVPGTTEPGTTIPGTTVTTVPTPTTAPPTTVRPGPGAAPATAARPLSGAPSYTG